MTDLPPTLIAICTTLTLLYPLTLAPKPSSYTPTLDSTLHLLGHLYPTLYTLFSLTTTYLLTLLATSSFTLSAAINALTLNLLYTTLYALSALNRYYGNGASRRLVMADQVAVVTGGAGGLGWLIAHMLARKGVAVAVWDVRAPDEWSQEQQDDEGGIRYYECDVGDADKVDETWRRTMQDVGLGSVCVMNTHIYCLGSVQSNNDLQQMGTPTILINNAGIVNGVPLLSLTPTALSRTFNINTLSHFHTCRTFLPSMLASPQGGTIVTVSSVLGHLGASHLTDYTASKAALLAFHTSLSAEVAAMRKDEACPGAKNMRMVLVKPGQLSTKMFESLVSPSDFFGPVVLAKDLAMAVVKAVEGGRRNEVVAMPVYAWLVEWMGVLPVSLQRVARWCSGVDRAMETFGGQRKVD
jgi:NAD(P)-dependent dehydrogenase (short-subunit alcohol dehydrogenase family)